MARPLIEEKLESLRRGVQRVRSRYIVHAICTGRLGDFERFAAAIDAHTRARE